MHRHQWIIFLPNFYTISRFYVTLYLLSYCVFRFSWCRAYIYIYIYVCVYVYVYICMYVYVCVYIYVHVYMYIYACECMLLCIHDYMYVFYVCSFYVYWFYDVFYLWLLGQRWPNKEVQTNKHQSIPWINWFCLYIPQYITTIVFISLILTSQRALYFSENPCKKIFCRRSIGSDTWSSIIVFICYNYVCKIFPTSQIK